jgi:ppGpp synthetase/RelA/SpoT-type nucleotidyltranferase
VHYYLFIDGIICEVQLRMWATDIWSEMHHKVIYKKTELVIPIEEKSVSDFGDMANLVDYYLLIRKKPLN